MADSDKCEIVDNAVIYVILKNLENTKYFQNISN